MIWNDANWEQKVTCAGSFGATSDLLITVIFDNSALDRFEGLCKIAVFTSATASCATDYSGVTVDAGWSQSKIDYNLLLQTAVTVTTPVLQSLPADSCTRSWTLLKSTDSSDLISAANTPFSIAAGVLTIQSDRTNFA